ncbi:hypothetical protein NPIL_1341 [Nephila pilipes]|uniref:Uncharacterized protein n=1 Tax=Nephila pilipes TaxID=299642 RepID=A0A8X6N8F7_NEPPI|nr:hypothetical protein NPIL_1341 [Nephila pilipes]
MYQEIVMEQYLINKLLYKNHYHVDEPQRSFNPQSLQLGEIKRCNASEQIVSPREFALPSFGSACRLKVTSYITPPDPIYSVQDILTGNNLSNTALPQQVTDNYSNFGTFSPTTVSSAYERSQEILDGSSSNVFSNNTTCAAPKSMYDCFDGAAMDYDMALKIQRISSSNSYQQVETEICDASKQIISPNQLRETHVSDPSLIDNYSRNSMWSSTTMSNILDRKQESLDRYSKNIFPNSTTGTADTSSDDFIDKKKMQSEVDPDIFLQKTKSLEEIVSHESDQTKSSKHSRKSIPKVLRSLNSILKLITNDKNYDEDFTKDCLEVKTNERLEQRKDEHEKREYELKKFELESKATLSDGNIPLTIPKLNLMKLMPRYNVESDISVYLSLFERQIIRIAIPQNDWCYKYEMLLPSNTDRMVAKRRSQEIWTPREKEGIRPPTLATKIGITNLQVKSSFVEKFPE